MLSIKIKNYPKGILAELSTYIIILMGFLLTHYLYVSSFGFYEDDWLFFGKGFSQPLTFVEVISPFRTFEIGRPFQFLMMSLARELLWFSQNLVFVYLFGAAFYSLGLFLQQKCLVCRFGYSDALVIIYIAFLFPIQTVTQFINGIYSFSFALIIASICILLYREKKYLRYLSYFLSFLILTCYELYFFLFLVAPLYFSTFKDIFSSKIKFWMLLRHLILCGAVFLIYTVARELSGQRGINSVNESTIGIGLLVAVIEQSWVTWVNSFGVYRNFLFVLQGASSFVSLGILISILIVGLGYSSHFKYKNDIYMTGTLWVDNLLFGLTLSYVGYMLSYFVSGPSLEVPLFTTRESRISVAVIFGHAIILYQISLGLLGVINNSFKLKDHLFSVLRIIIIIIIIIPLAIYALKIQSEYQKMWEYKKNLLAELISLTPDAKESTAFIIKVDGHSYMMPRMAIGQQPHDWGVYIDSLFEWDPSRFIHSTPQNSKKPVIVISTCLNWRESLVKEASGRYSNSKCFFYPYPTIALNNFIELEWKNGHLYRDESIIRLDDESMSIGFWENALPSINMNKLMPDFNFFFYREFFKNN